MRTRGRRKGAWLARRAGNKIAPLGEDEMRRANASTCKGWKNTEAHCCARWGRRAGRWRKAAPRCLEGKSPAKRLDTDCFLYLSLFRKDKPQITGRSTSQLERLLITGTQVKMPKGGKCGAPKSSPDSSMSLAAITMRLVAIASGKCTGRSLVSEEQM